MKKFLLSLLALVACVCVNAQDPKVVLDFTDGVNTWGLPDGSANGFKGEKTFTNGTYTIKVNAADNGYYLSSNKTLLFGKNNSSLTLPAFDFKVGKIVLKANNGSGKVTMNFFVGETEVSTSVTGISQDATFGINSDYQTAGTIYTLKVTNANNCQFQKIEIYESTGEKVKGAANLKWDKQTTTAILGNQFTSPKFTYSTDATITFASNNTAVATVDNEGVISLAGEEGEATITATSPATENYEAGETSIKVTVTHRNYYTKTNSIASGEKYIIVAAWDDAMYYMKPLAANKTYGYPDGGKLTGVKDEIYFNASDNYEFTITEFNGGYSICGADGRYYYNDNEHNSFNAGDEAQAWTITPMGDGTFKIAMGDYYIQQGEEKADGTRYTTFGVYNTAKNGTFLPCLYKYSGITSGVSNVTVNADNATVYNLAGQRVDANVKGIVIKGGKKFINK